ncbi:MAG: aromatic amino acid lyase, partial [Solirubrobacteraceae bacterium]
MPTLDELEAFARGAAPAPLDAADRERIAAGRAVVEAALATGRVVYGVSTGFGQLSSVRIDAADAAQLQVNLLRSHAIGSGEPLEREIVRGMLLALASSLRRGHSGVRIEVVELLLALLERDVAPVIPRRGSVGSSGDLAPLAHLTLALIGEGEFLVDGERRAAASVLRDAGIEPLILAAKEGLALINGTQVSTALALHALFSFEPVLESALVVGALTVDAARGSDGPFDPRIHALRGKPGQIDVARYSRALLAGSEIRRSHLQGDDRVQDPYSLRCQPQVVGACLDQLRHAALVLVREANAVTDNPLVFIGENGEEGTIVSGGNFHAEPV